VSTAPNGPAGNDLNVVLVEPEIHGNTGSSGRTCLAAGAQLHLVQPLGFDISDARVKRAGLDYWPRVQPLVWPDWDSLEARLGELGTAYFFSSDATVDFWDADFVDPVALVFGKESVGLSQQIRDKHADRLLRLPMHDPKLRSINLANSVAVVLYEVLRQRREARQNRIDVQT